jgi:hypothetical protein
MMDGFGIYVHASKVSNRCELKGGVGDGGVARACPERQRVFRMGRTAERKQKADTPPTFSSTKAHQSERGGGGKMGGARGLPGSAGLLGNPDQID